MGLTPGQERFCAEYIVDLNGSAAYRRAYPRVTSEHVARSNAYRLMQMPAVRARIEELQRERAERTQVTQDYVLRNLTEIVERCMQRAPVLNPGGEQATEGDRGVWRFEAKSAVAALKLLGEHLGMYTHRVEVETTASLTIIEEVVRATPPKDNPAL